MPINTLGITIRLTAAAAVLGVAGQSQALTLDVGDAVEYGYLKQENFDGDSTDANRLMCAAQ